MSDNRIDRAIEGMALDLDAKLPHQREQRRKAQEMLPPLPAPQQGETQQAPPLPSRQEIADAIKLLASLPASDEVETSPARDQLLDILITMSRRWVAHDTNGKRFLSSMSKLLKEVDQ